MKKTVKDTLKSVVVLFCIALLCVGLLSVANEFLKYEAKLDDKMAKQLYAVCPTGEDSNANAIDYFEMVDAGALVESVNDSLTGSEIVAVYRAVKGKNAGCYIIQSQAQGRDSTVVMLTAYDAAAKIMKTTCYSQAESYWKSNILGKYDDFGGVIGKSGQLSDTDVAINTGATMSMRAVAKALSAANLMAEELLKDRIKAFYSADGYENATESVSSLVDAANTAAPDADTRVLSVYKAVGGANDGNLVVIAQSKNGKWYPPLKMMTAYDKDGKIVKTECIYQAESYWDKVETSSFDNAIGKDGEVVGSEFVSTGATNTLDTIAKALTVSNKLVKSIITGGIV